MSTLINLHTGAKMPALAFGTWQDKESQYEAVKHALKTGYRHIDTAHIYGTEPAVGKAIKESGIPREELFITTKLWNNDHKPEDVPAALDASLKELGVEYVDLYLMHWPVAWKPGKDKFPKENDTLVTADIDYLDTYNAMAELVKTGKTKAIGVSNFSQKEIQRLLDEAKVKPAAHQIELHPYLQQADFVKWLQDNEIAVMAYSPFGNSNETYGSDHKLLIDDPVLVEVGKAHGKSGAQAALAWGISSGHAVLPKSKTPNRIEDNLAGDFRLSPAELKKVQGIDKKMRFNNPSDNFGWKFFEGHDGA